VRVDTQGEAGVGVVEPLGEDRMLVPSSSWTLAEKCRRACISFARVGATPAATIAVGLASGGCTVPLRDGADQSLSEVALAVQLLADFRGHRQAGRAAPRGTPDGRTRRPACAPADRAWPSFRGR
jgi:hypothetical protein